MATAGKLSSPRQGVWTACRHEALRDPVLHVDEAVERVPLVDADIMQRSTVELHVGEVLEERVVGLVECTLELLSGQRGTVLPRERIDLVADDDTQVLDAYLVDPLMD